MEDNIEIYKIWAPPDSRWADWAKPVLFASMKKGTSYGIDETPVLEWIKQADGATAVIVDLPGIESVYTGLALARLGYQPVPLFNGVKGSNAEDEVVPVDKLITALRDGASDLSKLNLRPDAPPAFLLDAGRMANGVENVAGKFDNRWCIFPQDMPSASYLISKGIRKIIVHMQTKSDDLVHILYRYQKLGIEIYLNTGNESKITEVKKPSALKSLFYRFSVIIKLKRNMAGGFGGAVLDFEETRYGHG